jgi:GNAT superfamily N-acetyltransferase
LIIRQSNKTDIEQLIKMRFDFTAEYQEIDPNLFESFVEESNQFFEEAIETDRWVIWVAEDKNRIVSHTFLEIIDTVPRPGRKKSPYGYVTNVYTIPEYRSKGIGSMIMDELNKWSIDNGLTFLMVWPSETSIDFYEKNGFKRNEEIYEQHYITISE